MLGDSFDTVTPVCPGFNYYYYYGNCYYYQYSYINQNYNKILECDWLSAA